MARRQPSTSGRVVDLSGVRARLRLTASQDKVTRALTSNEQALRALYTSGVMLSRSGTHAGRDLLLARQYLLKVASLLRWLADEGEVPAPRLPHTIEAVYEEVNLLLDRSTTLLERVAPFLERLPRLQR